MKRDGPKESLWQKNQPDYLPRNTAAGTEPYDVIVVGGGITGLTTGLLLQRAGKKCLIAEAFNLCYGTTGGTTAHLNTFFDTTYDTIENDFGEDGAQTVARATRQSLALFRKHVTELNIDCGFGTKDGFVYAQNEEQVKQLDKMYEASRRAGVEVKYVDQIPLPVPFQKAVVYRGQAQIHPTRYVYAIAKAFEEAGGTILQNCRMTGHEKQEDLLLVRTERGELKARYLIYATHIPGGINLLHFRCAPYRSYAMAVTLNNDAYPDALAYDMYDPYHYYRTQEVDGQRYLIVGGEDHKTAHVVNTESCFQNLERHVRKYFDVKEVAYRWSSQYFEPSDGLAYIGQLPHNNDNVFVATGYSGNGITYSHIAAITLSDLILKGSSEFAELFDPNRVKPVAGFAAFVKENADVVKEFIGKRLSTEKIAALSELAPGEGRLVKYEGKSLALYKDLNGKVHALNPVCSHAKCIVDWNSAEQSWDCPCHGARYSVDGEVITGPARHGLEKVALGGNG